MQSRAFPQAHVINLKRRKDRKDTFEKNWPSQFEKPLFFEAFDGQCIDKELVFESEDMRHVQNLLCKCFQNAKTGRGEFSCWVSHVTLWYKLSKTHNEIWTIFEDDAEFGPLFEKEYLRAYHFMHNRHETFLWMGGVPLKMKKDPGCTDLPKQNICQHVRGLPTHAYMINSQMAKAFMESISVLQKWEPFDIWLNRQCRNHKEISYVMNPPISQSLPFWSSDIQTVQDKLFKVKPKLN